MRHPAFILAISVPVLLAGLPVVISGADTFSACFARIRQHTIRSGVPRALTERALGKVRYDEKAVRFSRSQPEYRTPVWDYMAFLVDAERIRDGKSMLKRYSTTLAAIERKFGIDHYILTALWGIESNYGRHRGDFFLPHALANVICGGRKQRYFQKELVTALKLVKRGDIALGDLRSSWAGALGQTQFMPSTYRRLAVDFDGNGKRDLVRSVPDALASAANFLKKAGWRSRLGWGFEVTLPERYRGPHGRRRVASLSVWARRGLRRANGRKLSGKLKASLILPAGRQGPAFLVTRNFWALYSYNASQNYALAIAHLSDRLRGRGPLRRKWPTRDPGLSRKQRLLLQKRLLAAGYNIGKADGRIGPITRAAIRRLQKKHGLKPNGRPSRKILQILSK